MTTRAPRLRCFSIHGNGFLGQTKPRQRILRLSAPDLAGRRGTPRRAWPCRARDTTDLRAATPTASAASTAHTMSTPKTHLIVTSARSLPASIVASCVTTYGLDQDAAVVMTNCVLANDGVFAGALGAPNSVDILVSLADDPFVWHSAEVLKALATSLKPGARFVAAVLANSGNLAAAKQESFLSQTLSTCLVVGFANPHSTGTTTATGVIASLIATKPNWSKGAAFSLKSRKQKENVDSNTQNTQNNKWKVNHLSEDDLMDDDDILDESDFRFGAETAVAAKAAAGGGCDAKKSACKDCSCGRAEAESGGVELSDDKKKVRIVVTKSQHCFKPSWSALLVTFTAICYNYITSQVHCLPIQYTCRLKTDDTFFYLSQGVQIRVRELFPGRRVSVRGVPFAW